VSDRTATIDLVQHGMAMAVLIPAGERPLPPSEVIRKRPLVLEPGVFAEPDRFHAAMLETARARLASELGPKGRAPVALFALTGAHPDGAAVASTAELDGRVDALHALGTGVLVVRRPELYHVAQYALRYTSEPIRVASDALMLADVLHARHYDDLDGALLEAIAQLFACNVRMEVYPVAPHGLDRLHAEVARWIGPPRADGLIGLEQLQIPRPLSHLVDYLVESGFLCSVDVAERPG
jgi:hypothetical protein